MLSEINALQVAQDGMHSYIGATIGPGHTAFENPFVIHLYSKVKRLFAQWEMNNNLFGNELRLEPEDVYGDAASDPEIVENMESTATDSWRWTNISKELKTFKCRKTSMIRFKHKLILNR